jgi:single-strand DNA-binding protein
MSFNKIIVVGNLGRDPELRYTPQGDAVCNFSIAVNDKRRDKTGELQDATTWFKVTLWRKQAETASKYLTKGSSVYIEGRLRVEEWTDRDGKSRFTLEISATDMQFLSTTGSGGGRGEETSQENSDSDREFSNARHTDNDETQTLPSDDDIPF